MTIFKSILRLPCTALLLFGLSINSPAIAVTDASQSSKNKSKSSAHKIHKLAQKKSKAALPASTEYANFNEWAEVASFIQNMVQKHGFDQAQLEQVFHQVQYLEKSIQLMKPAPAGKTKNWQVYRSRFVENNRIDAGIAFWDKYAETLQKAEQTYGIPAEIIVGLIGVETMFGRNTGSFKVIDSLTTLAFAYPDTPNRIARMNFFRGELEQFLLLTRNNSALLFSLKGSYAGAIGLPQFMPGSIRNYAVDFDGDGQIDLLNSSADAIGSVAHYLAKHGWKKAIPSVFPATLNSADTQQLNEVLGQGLKASYRLNELKPLATTADPNAPQHLMYGLIDLQNGENPSEYWLATDNFYAITQYNRSYFYAMSVIDLGHVIATARIK